MSCNSNAAEESFSERRARSTLSRLKKILLRTEVEAPIMRELATIDFDSALSNVGQRPIARNSFEAELERDLLPYEPNLLPLAQQIDNLISEYDYRIFITVEQLFDVWNRTAVALPTLANYLHEPWQEDIGARHIRLFAQRAGQAYWNMLEALFLETDVLLRPFTKEALAVALSEIVMANKNAPADTLASLALDASHGAVRKYFYRPILQSKTQTAQEAISRLDSDPEVGLYTILIPNGSRAEASLVPTANL